MVSDPIAFAGFDRTYTDVLTILRYTGLPVMNTKCDNETCKNGAAYSLDITYCFPQWFLARAIYLVVAKAYTGEPTVSLTVRRRVDHTRRPNILRLARSGNIEAIRTLLEGREAFLNDIEASNGRTALQVCNCNRNLVKSLSRKLINISSMQYSMVTLKLVNSCYNKEQILT